MGKRIFPRRPGGNTFTDFSKRIAEDQKADLLHGVIYMASPEFLAVNDLQGWLLTILRIFVRRKDLGRIYHSRVAMRLSAENAPEPDIMFVQKNRLHLADRGYIDGHADLAIEMVTPESVDRDYYDKRELFERFPIPEYWIIEPFEKTVMFLRLNARGRYREVRLPNDVFRSEVLADFWLRVDWLWQHPLPDELDTVQEILAGLPSN